jgi:hypothetical protein
MRSDTVEIASVKWENDELTIVSEKGEEWAHPNVRIADLRLGQGGALTITFQRDGSHNELERSGRAAHEDDWDD